MFADEVMRCSKCVDSAVAWLARLLNTEASYQAYQRYAKWRVHRLVNR